MDFVFWLQVGDGGFELESSKFLFDVENNLCLYINQVDIVNQFLQ